MKNLLADIDLSPSGGFSGPGALGSPTNANAGTLFDKVISLTLGLLTSIAFIYFTINFLIAALGWITAGSDTKQVEAVRTKLVNNLIGLVVTVAAIFVIDFVGKILGIDILNPTSVLGL